MAGSGNLREEVGDVFIRITRGKRRVGKSGAAAGEVEASRAHRKKRREYHAFLGEDACVGRKRTRARAADFGMVRAHGDITHAQSPDENRRDRGDIGQMRAAKRRMVGDGDITLSEFEHRGNAAHANA